MKVQAIFSGVSGRDIETARQAYALVYSVKEYDWANLQKLSSVPWPKGRRAKRQKGFRYADVVAAFDIETSRLADIEQSIMYCWMLAIGKDVIIGRTWDEYKLACHKITKNLQGLRLVTYVHNLSYEFQFLSGIFNLSSENVFAIERRKVAYCTIGDMEYRCGYIHSNMSLGEWSKKMGVEHSKQLGDLDYRQTRYPWTALTVDEWRYAIYDVLAEVECVQADLWTEGDTLATIPLTNTGYVRRDCRRAMQTFPREWLSSLAPSMDLYTLLRKAFRGGDTHANRFYAGRILKEVHGVDIVSSYPAQLVIKQYPMSRFRWVQKPSSADVKRLLQEHKPFVARILLTDVQLKDMLEGFPYIPVDKCLKKLNYVNDNGRVLSADAVEIAITDIDFKILHDQYSWNTMRVYELAYSQYGMLPEQLRRVVMDYYSKKTELKGVEGQEVQYMKSKNKVNACYGMMAQKPVKQSVLFDDGEWSYSCTSDRQLLEEYNEKAFLVYQWGVWCTAHARYALHEMRKLVGAESCVYCDTDSVKYVGEHDFSALNAARTADAVKAGGFATAPNGDTYHLGIAEHDCDYERFITWGAKKYAYEDDRGLHITVAGVAKKKGAAELEAHGGLDAFKIGFVFRDAGGTESVYNDFPPMDHVIVDGYWVPITRNIVIRDSTYQLGLSGHYEEILIKQGLVLREIERSY